MFVVMSLQKFNMEGKLNGVLPVEIKADTGKMLGYLPVYETREDAEKDYPDSTIVEARFVKEGKG